MADAADLKSAGGLHCGGSSPLSSIWPSRLIGEVDVRLSVSAVEASTRLPAWRGIAGDESSSLSWAVLNQSNII